MCQSHFKSVLSHLPLQPHHLILAAFYDSVLHIQKLISNHLQEPQCTMNNIQEITDGCTGQYKGRHCLGDLSCSLATLGYTVQSNSFATLHAKGEQDTACSHVKQKKTTV